MTSGIGRPTRVYSLYGLRLKSEWPVPCPPAAGPGPVEVELVRAPESAFVGIHGEAGVHPESGDWFHYRRLDDGSDYLRWSGQFEFLVSSDGRKIAGRPLNGASLESFHTYLLGQVLSFSLLKQGIEPLHSTAVVLDGQAVCFLGDSGYGKSCLGAAFVEAGFVLLTDDLLVLKEIGGRFHAYPGPHRIKLFPGIAEKLLGDVEGSSPMNSETEKHVIPLERNGSEPQQGPVPLGRIYILAPPGEVTGRSDISITEINPGRRCIELISNTFNTLVEGPERLKNQFELVTKVTDSVVVKSLSYPRTLNRLPAVREAVLEDLTSTGSWGHHPPYPSESAATPPRYVRGPDCRLPRVSRRDLEA